MSAARQRYVEGSSLMMDGNGIMWHLFSFEGISQGAAVLCCSGERMLMMTGRSGWVRFLWVGVFVDEFMYG